MTIKDEMTATFEGLCEWHQERSILETSEMICAIMDKKGVSRVELAERLGKSKGFISQLLDGTANMTLRTISDMFVALGYEFHPGNSELNALALDVPVNYSGAKINSTPDTMDLGQLSMAETFQFTFGIGDKSATIAAPYSKSA